MPSKLISSRRRERDYRKSPDQYIHEGKVYRQTARGYYQADDGTWLHRVKYRGKIPRGWVVHHVNLRPWDNRQKNLVAVPAPVHAYIHRIIAKTNYVLSVSVRRCRQLTGMYLKDQLDVTSDKLPDWFKPNTKQQEWFRDRLPPELRKQA